MSVEIVKVQRPIATNDPDAPWLIYDRDRKHVEERPAALIRKQIKEWMGTRHKGYFRAAWSSVVGWGISAKVPDQDW